MSHSLFRRSAWLTLLPLGLALAFAGNALGASTVPMGDAASFGALSATAMTNSGGLTVVNGDVGSSTSIDAGVTNGSSGSQYGAGSSQLFNAQASLLTAFGAAAGATPDQPTITGANLAGMTLDPGVYNATGDILISGPTPLTLDGRGDPSSVFIFQAGAASDLTVDPTSSVQLTNGAQACNVFWKVQSAFLKNSGSVFTGTILALTQITLTDGITVNGRVLARNADVTFIHDVVNTPSCAAAAAGGSSGSPASAATSGSTPDRTIYCDAAGTSYNLVIGEDILPPYNTLGLVPGYVNPLTGSISCEFPAAAPTPVPVPVTPVPTPVPTPVTPKPTAKPKAKPAVHHVKAAKIVKKKAAVHAAPPLSSRFGFTG